MGSTVILLQRTQPFDNISHTRNPKKCKSSYSLFINNIIILHSTLYKCTPLGTEHKCAFKEGVHL